MAYTFRLRVGKLDDSVLDATDLGALGQEPRLEYFSDASLLGGSGEEATRLVAPIPRLLGARKAKVNGELVKVRRPARYYAGVARDQADARTFLRPTVGDVRPWLASDPRRIVFWVDLSGICSGWTSEAYRQAVLRQYADAVCTTCWGRDGGQVVGCLVNPQPQELALRLLDAQEPGSPDEVRDRLARAMKCFQGLHREFDRLLRDILGRQPGWIFPMEMAGHMNDRLDIQVHLDSYFEGQRHRKVGAMAYLQKAPRPLWQAAVGHYRPRSLGDLADLAPRLLLAEAAGVAGAARGHGDDTVVILVGPHSATRSLVESTGDLVTELIGRGANEHLRCAGVEPFQILDVDAHYVGAPVAVSDALRRYEPGLPPGPLSYSQVLDLVHPPDPDPAS